MSVFRKTISGAALTDLTGLEAHMKAILCIDFVNSVRPGQSFNCRGYVKSVFMAKNCPKDTKICSESLSRFLCVTGSDSVIEGKTEGAASFLNHEKRNNFLKYNHVSLNFAFFSA